MNKAVTIHQPNYLPWLGFFGKIKKSECFVILDNVGYNRKGIAHRNKIRVADGWTWLTLPISKSPLGTPINEITLSNNTWQKKHWETIRGNYTRTDYFNTYGDFFENLYQENHEYLWQINEKIIFYMLNCFGIDVEVVRASSLKRKPESKKTDLLIEILKEVGAETYIAGSSGRNYLEREKFKDCGINLEFCEFTHPVYKQRYPGFEPGMAAIDLLFNLGEKSKELF
ncbi:MAG: WbqC family protein [Candidatus Scalindua sp.]